jgi:hypothetical protein
VNATYSRGYHEEGATSLPAVRILRLGWAGVNGAWTAVADPPQTCTGDSNPVEELAEDRATPRSALATRILG